VRRKELSLRKSFFQNCFNVSAGKTNIALGLFSVFPFQYFFKKELSCRLSENTRDRNMAEDNTQSSNADGGQSKTPKVAKMGKSKGSQEEDPENMPSSLFILSEANLIRRAARATINSMAFEYTILGAILVNCIVMAMEEHLPSSDKSVFTAKLDKTENYFLVIFSTETFLKIIAQGFILHPGSYMRNVWNSMDFFVVVTGLVYHIAKIVFVIFKAFFCLVS